MRRTLLCALASVLLLAVLGAAEADPREILRSMGEAADRIQDYTMVLVRQERRGDKLEPEQMLQEKWARPYKIYMKSIGTWQNGQEVLFVRGWNRDRIRAHKGSFPDLTVNLDPRGSWAMAHTHHPVTDVSLIDFVRLVLSNLREADQRGEGTARLLGEDTLWGRPCYRLELTCPDRTTSYFMREGETLWDVARVTGQQMYVILHYNRRKGWESPRDPRPGEQVLVPRYYASKVQLWVDEELRLPIQALIYDFEGKLYERYEHRDLRINAGLTDEDFDPSNRAYDF